MDMYKNLGKGRGEHSSRSTFVRLLTSTRTAPSAKLPYFPVENVIGLHDTEEAAIIPAVLLLRKCSKQRKDGDNLPPFPTLFHLPSSEKRHPRYY